MSSFVLSAAARRGVAVPPPPHTAEVLGDLAASIMLRPRHTLRRMPRELAYLETARRLPLPTSAGELMAWTWGSPEAPLVGLVHGWEGHGAQLGAFAAPLAAAGFRVLAFDAPAHGESPGEEASVPALGRLLIEMGGKVGPFFGLVGHSMGAAGSALAATYGAGLKGLVLIAPPRSQRDRVERVAARLQLAGEVREAFFAAVERRTGETYARVDLLAAARLAPCPALFFHDPADEDTAFAGSADVAAAWPGATLVPCPGRGHHRITATPEVVRQAVGFFARLRG